MARRADLSAIGPFVGVVCALLLLGAGAATWVSEPVARSVGEVALVERRATTGMEVAPLTVVAALAGVVCSVSLLATKGRVRRSVALVLVVVGLVGVLTVGAGLSRLRLLDGAVTPAPWLALTAGVGVLAAGLVGLRTPGRRLPARYEVGVAPTDTEWRLASETVDGGAASEVASHVARFHAADHTDGQGDPR